MKKILFIIFIVFTSCKNNNQKIEIPKNVDDNFNIFLKYFSKDSIFQISRVNFPLKVKELDSDENFETIEKNIDISEYKKINLNYSNENLTKETDKYSQNIKIGTDKAVIEIRGIDNGIHTDIVFEKKKGKWKLITWIDSST